MPYIPPAFNCRPRMLYRPVPIITYMCDVCTIDSISVSYTCLPALPQQRLKLMQKRPTLLQKNPALMQKRPTLMQKRPVWTPHTRHGNLQSLRACSLRWSGTRVFRRRSSCLVRDLLLCCLCTDICVCMYAQIQWYMSNGRAPISVRLHTHTHMHTHIHTRTCKHARPHSHVHTHTCTHTHTHTDAHTHIHAHTHTHMCTHTCTHTHTNTSTYTRTHTHTHIHTSTYIYTFKCTYFTYSTYTRIHARVVYAHNCVLMRVCMCDVHTHAHNSPHAKTQTNKRKHKYHEGGRRQTEARSQVLYRYQHVRYYRVCCRKSHDFVPWSMRRARPSPTTVLKRHFWNRRWPIYSE